MNLVLLLAILHNLSRYATSGEGEGVLVVLNDDDGLTGHIEGGGAIGVRADAEALTVGGDDVLNLSLRHLCNDRHKGGKFVTRHSSYRVKILKS